MGLYLAIRMSRLFESFETLDRGWDVRALEGQSQGRVFVWLLVMAFIIGADAAVVSFFAIRSHHFVWSAIVDLAVFLLIGFRYSRAFYRRLQ